MGCAIPYAVDPPSPGSGPPPGPPCQADLDAGSDAGGSGGGLLGSPGPMAGGMAYRNHPRIVTRRRSPAILEPERPRRRRPNRNPRLPPARQRSWRTLPYAARARGRAARPAAGPTSHLSTVCRSAATVRAPRFPRQPPGVRRDGRRATAAAAGARPGGGACGPSRAALIDVQKVLPQWPAAGLPAPAQEVTTG